MYCHSYRCRKCGDSLWKYASKLLQHERTCTGGVRRVYPGGMYHSTPSVFERLDDENIRKSESLRYYPYRATFEFECWFDTEQLPSDNDKVHWIARHVPLSVSVASNVPGHEQVECLGESRRIRQHQTLLRGCVGTTSRNTDGLGRTGASCTIIRRQGISTTDQSVQNAHGTTLWMDA